MGIEAGVLSERRSVATDVKCMLRESLFRINSIDAVDDEFINSGRSIL